MRLLIWYLILGFDLLIVFIATFCVPLSLMLMTSGIIKKIIAALLWTFAIGLGAANVLIDIDRIKKHIK